MAMTSSQSFEAPVLSSRNPATGEIIGTVPIDSLKAVREKVARARAASVQWGKLSYAQRREELSRWRREIASRLDEFADLVHRENGKPHLDALQEIMMALSHLDHAAKRAPAALATHKVPSGVMANFRATVSYVPLGVVGVIGPWNYPVFTPMGSIAYALAAGNAVVHKPSELTPLIALFLEETAHATLSIPDAFLVCPGDGSTGAALAGANIDKIAFTGSTATGRKVMKAAADKLTPVLMELGGKDPLIVCDDADIDAAAEAAVYGALQNAGQACTSIERCYVVGGAYGRFVDRVVEEAKIVTAGSTRDSKIGAMTSPAQVDIVRDHMEDAIEKGAKVLLGGPDKIHGSFIEPTVLVDVTSNMKIMQEETFGPVLPIVRVESADEAVEAANSTVFGLGSAVFAKEGAREIADRIRAGMTAVNSVLAFAAIPALPFGGIGDSGFGRIHGDEGLREFARTKATAEHRFGLPMNLISFNQPDNIYDQLKKTVVQLYGGGAVDKATSAWATVKRWRRKK